MMAVDEAGPAGQSTVISRHSRGVLPDAAADGVLPLADDGMQVGLEDAFACVQPALCQRYAAGDGRELTLPDPAAPEVIACILEGEHVHLFSHDSGFKGRRRHHLPRAKPVTAEDTQPQANGYGILRLLMLLVHRDRATISEHCAVRMTGLHHQTLRNHVHAGTLKSNRRPWGLQGKESWRYTLGPVLRLRFLRLKDGSEGQRNAYESGCTS